MTPEEFRRARDECALEAYRARWPILRADEIRLYAEIRAFEATADKRHIDDAKVDKAGLYYELQRVRAELAAIEADVPIRQRRLGIMEAA